MNGFRLRHKWVTDGKNKCRICYAERKPKVHGHNKHGKHSFHTKTTHDTLVLIHGFTASKDVWLPVCKVSEE